MHLTWMNFWTGGNRVEPGLQLLQQADELGRGECRAREGQQKIDYLPPPGELLQLAIDSGRRQSLQGGIAGFFRDGLQEGMGNASDFVVVQEGVPQRSLLAMRSRHRRFFIALESAEIG